MPPPSLSPPSLSFLPLCFGSITSRGDWEERSKACSSQSVIYSSLFSSLHCTTQRICSSFVGRGRWGEETFSSLSGELFIFKGRFSFSNSIFVLLARYYDRPTLAAVECESWSGLDWLALVLFLPDLWKERGQYEIWLQWNSKVGGTSEDGLTWRKAIFSCGVASFLLRRARSLQYTGGKGRQKLQVFGFESFKFIDQKKRDIIRKTHKSRFGFISSLHHGWDVRML